MSLMRVCEIIFTACAIIMFLAIVFVFWSELLKKNDDYTDCEV